MIPKTIHFCWLSGETMPAKMRRCRASWRRHLPGYAYALWDWRRVEACRAESGFDFAWVRHWYERKNYAFAADYLRLWALWREGGIYLDVDVEVLKPFDALLAQYTTSSASLSNAYSAQVDVIVGNYNPTGKLSVTMPSCEAVIALTEVRDADGNLLYEECASPNDVPGYDKDQYMDPEVLAQSPSGSYIYKDADGNSYVSGFGLSY